MSAAGTPDVTREVDRLRHTEALVAWARLAAVPLAIIEVGVTSADYPKGYEASAWVVTAVLAAGAALFLLLSRRPSELRRQRLLGLLALAFDTAIVAAFVFVYAFEPGTPIRMLMFLPLIEAAVRYGLRGGLVLPLVHVPILAVWEASRAARFSPDEAYVADNVVFPVGMQLLVGLIVGGLVERLRRETETAEARAREAEDLRDQIGRRADRLEVVNRSARAASSSLDLDEALRLFAREAGTAVPFDRLAIVLAEGGRAEVIANVGHGETTTFPKGTSIPIVGTALEELVRDPQTIVRDDMAADSRYREEEELVAAGLRSRVVAPLWLAGRTLGLISVSRAQPAAFSREEIELVTLLGRQLTTAVENIRAFEAERAASDELRRLSTLRADFVSLVSHELRGPLAAVIGCAATLRQRWRTLTAEQRESFLQLIEQETTRLAGLVGDVLDTSRMEAGTFSYSFSDVDLEALVREVSAFVDLGQDDVAVRAEVAAPLPPVRGDRDRIRQLLMNLVMNAVKYTVAGDEVEVRAAADNGAVTVSVSDHGPGISREEQSVIFEKFRRATPAGAAKPGAGLGLFIARSIAEAHGGSLDVESEEGAGATFTVRLPLSAR